MKKLTYIFSAVCLALLLVSCSEQETLDQSEMGTPATTESDVSGITQTDDPENDEPLFAGKIAIISYTPSGDSAQYDSAQMVVQKYDENKISHVTWPDNFMNEQEQMENIIVGLGSNQDIKAIVVNEAVPGTSSAFARLRETRKDIVVIYIQPQDAIVDSVQSADICLAIDKLSMGSAMVQQAHEMGAKTFVHYSFMHHMLQPLSLTSHLDLIQEECKRLGIEFVGITALDAFDVGFDEAEQFIVDDVIQKVAQYGQDTAFFASNCSMQASLIEAVVETSAIYPQPCCPSPYHGFPAALGIETYLDGNLLPAQEIIERIRETLAAKNMLGRLSTWPESSSNLLTAASADYAIKWINGEVPREGVDVDVLKQLMMDYAGVEVYLTPYTDAPPYTEEGTGETYDNFLLMRMDYITF